MATGHDDAPSEGAGCSTRQPDALPSSRWRTTVVEAVGEEIGRDRRLRVLTVTRRPARLVDAFFGGRQMPVVQDSPWASYVDFARAAFVVALPKPYRCGEVLAPEALAALALDVPLRIVARDRSGRVLRRRVGRCGRRH